MSAEELHHIASRLAAASEVFPIPKTDDFDSAAYAFAENGIITVVVTDHLGRTKREYRAVFQLIAESVRPDNCRTSAV